MEVRNENQNTNCGFMVLCVDMLRRPCKREKEHQGGHNPFNSEGPNDAIAKDSVVIQKSPIPVPIMNTVPTVQHVEPVINTTGEQCIWMGSRGRCQYVQGHYPATPHKEFVPEGF